MKYTGREVSCSAIRGLFEALSEAGISLDELTAGLPGPVRHYRDPTARISWDSFRELLSRAAEYWSDEQFMSLGALGLSASHFRARTLMATLVVGPARAYRYIAGPGFAADFACAGGRFIERDERRVEITLGMAPGYESSHEFCLILKGACAALPTLYALPAASVEVRETSGGAHFEIELPVTLNRFSRLRWWLKRVVAFKTLAAEVVAVLLDVSMPVMGGEEALSRIRRLRGDVPVLMLSGLGELPFADRVAEDPALAFLEKPYRGTDLVRKLRELLSRASTK